MTYAGLYILAYLLGRQTQSCFCRPMPICSVSEFPNLQSRVVENPLHNDPSSRVGRCQLDITQAYKVTDTDRRAHDNSPPCSSAEGEAAIT